MPASRPDAREALEPPLVGESHWLARHLGQHRVVQLDGLGDVPPAGQLGSLVELLGDLGRLRDDDATGLALAREADACEQEHDEDDHDEDTGRRADAEGDPGAAAAEQAPERRPARAVPAVGVCDRLGVEGIESRMTSAVREM